MRWKTYAMGFVPNVLVVHAVITAGVFGLNQLLAMPPQLSIVYHKTLILSILMVVIRYLVSFIHEILTLAMSAPLNNFTYFWGPLIEHAVVILFVYAMSHCATHSTGLGLNFNQLAVALFVYNTTVLYMEFLSFANYKHKFAKFLCVYDVWVHQDTYRGKYKNDSAIAALLLNIVDEGDESVRSYNSDETLLNKKISLFKLPSSFNVTNDTKMTNSQLTGSDNETNIVCSNENTMTGVKGKGSATLYIPMENEPTNVPMESDPSNSDTLCDPVVPIEHARKNSYALIRMERSLSTFKSTYDLVDKLYSVSPKNTYHLNTVEALNAETLTCDREYDSIGKVDPLADLPEQYDNIIESPKKKKSRSEHNGEIQDTLSDTEEIAYQQDPAIEQGIQESTVSLHKASTIHLKSSLGTSDTHWGGGGGGNFKFKAPGGGKVEFGGGAGFDYRKGKRGSEDSGDDKRGDGRKRRGSDKAISSRRHSISNSNSVCFMNAYDDRPLIARVASFINWFEWLAPPFLPLNKKREGSGSFPLLRERLSSYNFDRACSVLTLNYGTMEEQKPQDYASFKYFVSYYYDYRKIDVDPMFERYGVLHTEMSYGMLLACVVNQLMWSAVMLCGYGAMFIWLHIALLPIIIVASMFRLNYLKGGSPRRCLFYEHVVNIVVMCVIVFIVL